MSHRVAGGPPPPTLHGTPSHLTSPSLPGAPPLPAAPHILTWSCRPRSAVDGVFASHDPAAPLAGSPIGVKTNTPCRLDNPTSLAR